ncbi:hypothetical protein M3Y97_00019500 [Aphelenchoides bicaudatus]|nr:hypothetical protein M3Y97_00019500 [Aphelenchoides bicaudatus]
MPPKKQQPKPSNDGDSAKINECLKRMDREIAALNASIKSKGTEIQASKTKYLKLNEEYVSVNGKIEKLRSDYSFNLKLLQQPKPKNMTPLYDGHLNAVSAFFDEQNQISTGLVDQLEEVLNEFNLSQFRFLNVQTSLQDLVQQKAKCLREYNACNEKILQVEKEYEERCDQLARMQDLGEIPLDLRIGALELFRQRMAKLRKIYQPTYLKNVQLVANNSQTSFGDV